MTDPTPAPPASAEAAPEAVPLDSPVPERPVGPEGPPESLDEASRFVVSLHVDHLRNLTTLSVSAAGGGLLALQAGVLTTGPATAVPLASFALAAVVAVLSQRALIRDLGTTGVPSRGFAWMSEVAALLFGAGVGSAAVILFVAPYL